jgi:hypothetical protein
METQSELVILSLCNSEFHNNVHMDMGQGTKKMLHINDNFVTLNLIL